MNILKNRKDAPEIEERKDKKVMVAEDDPHSTLLMKILLRTTGFPPENISYAKNGLEAVEMAKKDIFDVIFMDIKMPFLDGVEATKIIKSNGNKWSTTKIIACTASPNGIQEESDRRFFNGVIIKPFQQNQFVDKLKDLLNSEKTATDEWE